jgi:hypothetical protein
MADQNRPVIQRREMLRRAAIVGGSLVWAVPAVQTLAPKAFAQTASPVFGCCECRSGAVGREKCNGLDRVQCTTAGSAATSETTCAQFCASQGKSYCFHASPTPLNCVPVGGGRQPRFACTTEGPPGND